MNSYELVSLIILSSMLILLVSYRLLTPFSKCIVNGNSVGGFPGFLLSLLGLFVGLTVGFLVMGFVLMLIVGIPTLVLSIILLVFVAIILFLLLSPLLIFLLLVFGIGSKTISVISNKK